MTSLFVMYQRTLDYLRLRSRAYKLTFTDPKNNEVLKDLAKFCRADTSYTSPNLVNLGIAIGRREVWLRIQHHLRLTPDQLYEIYNKPSTLNPPTQNREHTND